MSLRRILIFLFCISLGVEALAAPEAPKSEAMPAFSVFLSPKPDGHSVFYTVMPGDNFTKISRKNHVTPDLLIMVNGVEDRRLQSGMKIKIPTYKLSLVVDKSQNTLTLKGDEEILKSYPVATGINNSTPVGTFVITDKLVNPTWYKNNKAIAPGDPENQLGTRWMGINKKSYGIHGTIEPDKLGQQITAGCVRMKNEEVEELYRIVPPGTPVTIVDKK